MSGLRVWLCVSSLLAAKTRAVAWPGRSIDRTGKHTPSPCRYMGWVSKWAMLVIRDDILLIYLLCKLMLMRIRWTKCIYLQSLFDDRERAQSQFASNPLKIAIRCARCSLLAAIDLHLKRSPSITQPFIISCIVYTNECPWWFFRKYCMLY